MKTHYERAPLGVGCEVSLMPTKEAPLVTSEKHIGLNVHQATISVLKLNLPIACSARPRYLRPIPLYKEGDKTGGHERGCPNQVEVEPRLTEKCEAELSIDHPSYQPGDCKIGNRMDACGEHAG